MNCPDWRDDAPRDAHFKAAVSRAYRQVAVSVGSRMVSSGDPSQWHRTVFEGRVPLDYYAGNYRQNDPHRPCLARDVSIGGIAGSAYQSVIAEITLLFDDLRRELAYLEVRWSTLSPENRALFVATWIASLVGNFVRVHPFLNGNGRMSRLLWTWGLLRLGLPVQCRITERPSPPYAGLMNAAMTRNLAPLALHILQAMGRARPTIPGVE
jgi:fido (protein-threonine AMPylation protein)